MTDFQQFPKIVRLSGDVVVTEKIDGTNASIFIGDAGEFLTGSRTRWITPEDDNYGFSRWAHEHKDELLTLGPGRHFGEYWGSGIRRKYGLTEKRFSLFNVHRWALHGTEPAQYPTSDPRVFKSQDVLPPCVGLVPVLYRGAFNTAAINEILDVLASGGSVAAPGFMKPEGIVVSLPTRKTFRLYVLFDGLLESNDVAGRVEDLRGSAGPSLALRARSGPAALERFRSPCPSGHAVESSRMLNSRVWHPISSDGALPKYVDATFIFAESSDEQLTWESALGGSTPAHT